MKLSDFSFELPDELIAQFPAQQRTSSRLLVLNDNQAEPVEHKVFSDLIDYLEPNDLLVFNDTKVIPARLFGQKPTGAKIEILIERLMPNQQALVFLKANKSPKAGTQIIFDGDLNATVIGRQENLYILQFDCDDVLTHLESFGHIPLPPYMNRDDALEDKDRYQTVYAKEAGAVAAPTAGLHFDDEFLAKLKAKGVESAFVTLHVGAGTFQPISIENVLEHKMHSERAYVSQQVVDQIAATKAKGGRVIAVGTTSVRSLESAAIATGQLEAFEGETEIFIYPGFKFNVIDALVTNFHLPESTLMLLVSALAGKESILDAYDDAIKNEYRFFSYGDSMFITPNKVIAQINSQIGTQIQTDSAVQGNDQKGTN
jgi:S-adenosylmethionine:tRNA ribosyltransferase-isomerase